MIGKAVEAGVNINGSESRVRFSRSHARALHELLNVSQVSGYIADVDEVQVCVDDAEGTRCEGCCLLGRVGGNNNVILAVSIGANPVAQSGTNWINQSWNKYRIPLAQTNKFLDFPTLGVDGNGVYIAANYFVNYVYQNQQIAAIRKDTL